MKKIFYAFAAMSLLFAAASCNTDNSGINLDDIVLDGFYVYGDATGAADKVLSQNAMAAGFNEVEKAARTGMYEKYIYLEGGKDFALIDNKAGTKVYYGAELAEVNYGYDETDPDCKNFADNPNMKILQGQLIIGESAPKMQVKESGLYHIVLDSNEKGDLAQGAQIIVQKADFGVRGGCNSWGFTAGEQQLNNDGTIIFTWKNLEFSANGEFKFASCHGWKINLDEDGTVKAEISFGLEDGKLALTSTNISVVDAGLYDITLTYAPKAGALAASFSYEVTLTQKSELPTECYLIGDEFGNWDWASEEVVSLIPAHSEPGAFWAIRYISDPAKGFKFCPKKEWNGDFSSLDTNEGFTVDGGNCHVAEAGLYMFDVDLKNRVLNIHKAEVFGMGDVFGNWDEGANAFEIADGTFTATAKAVGDLRMYAKSALEAATGNWWHREFNIYDGKIVYRAAGTDQAAVAVTADQTITLDFNAGTGSIK